MLMWPFSGWATLWALGFSLAALACGGSDRGSGPPLSSGSGGNSGVGGGTGGVGGGGTGGGNGGGGAGACELNDLVFSGSVDSRAKDGKIQGRGAAAGASFQPWRQSVFMVHGVLAAWGDVESETDVVVTGKALLSGPPGSFLAGAQIFSNAATLTYSDYFQPISLTELHSVGECPGSPVSGSLTFCIWSGTGSTCDSVLQGTIGSDMISENIGAALGSSHDDPPPVYDLVHGKIGDDGFISVQADPDGDGVLVLPSSSSIDPGGVYCLNEATIVDQGSQWDVSVTALSRAGALPGTPVAGALDIEYCFPN